MDITFKENSFEDSEDSFLNEMLLEYSCNQGESGGREDCPTSASWFDGDHTTKSENLQNNKINSRDNNITTAKFSKNYRQEDFSTKPTLSYVALIGLAILSSPDKKMRLSDIYRWVCKKFPFYKANDQSWRNSIRHNLSLNECFIKTGRDQNSNKGNFWAVHPANVIDFTKGDFRRRLARLKVRKSKITEDMISQIKDSLICKGSGERYEQVYQTISPNGYVPMTSWNAPLGTLINMFGIEAVTSLEERTNYMSRSEDSVCCEIPCQRNSFIGKGQNQILQ